MKYCDFDTILLAIRKGWKWNDQQQWDKHDGDLKKRYPLVYQAELQQWLREQLLQLNIHYNENGYDIVIKRNGDNNIINERLQYYPTYEQALEEGLYKCLNLL